MVNLMEGVSDPEKNYCFLCDRSIEFSSDQHFDKLDKNLEMCHKFCTLVSRFLNFSCDDESVGNFKPRETLDMKSATRTRALDMEQQICDGCFDKAEKFCDLYSVFTKVKLQLKQGVEDMAGLMKNVQTVSRGKHDSDNSRNKNVEAMGFRRMFLAQVQNRFKTKYPRLKLERVETRKEPETRDNPSLTVPLDSNSQNQENDIEVLAELGFNCRVCFKRFKTWRNYKIHHSKVHNYSQHDTVTENKNKNKFSCNICGKRFRYSMHLKIHETTHTGKKLYRCQICDRIWNVADNLKRHLLSFHGLDITRVNKMCISEEIVENEMLAENENVPSSSSSKISGPTSESNFEVQQPTATLNHGDDKSNESEASVDIEHEYETEAAGEAVNKVDNAVQEGKIVQETKQLHFKCRFCLKRFSAWKNCKIHQTLAHKRRASRKMPNLVISNFGKTKTGIVKIPVFSKDETKLMMANWKKKPTGKKTGAKTGNSVNGANRKQEKYLTQSKATSSTCLNKYEMRKRREKPDEFEIFTDDQNPNENQVTNPDNESLPIKCTLCDKGFRTLRNCKIHKTIVHKTLEKAENSTNNAMVKDEVSINDDTDNDNNYNETGKNEAEKEFKCNYCNKIFRLRTTLIFHEMNNHTEEKPQVCELCGTIWTTLSNLKVHLSVTHGLADEEAT